MNGHTPDASDEKAAFHQTGANDGTNKGKEKEQEDVLPYLQNAILEQQSVESGPLPIQRLDVRSPTSMSTATSRPPSPTKGGLSSARQNDEDVLPYLQNAVLEQHTAGEKPLQIQRLDGSLSDTVPTVRSPRSGGPPALASAFGATSPSGSGKGATPMPPPPMMLRHQPPPLPTSHLQQASASSFASSSSPLSLHHASSSSSSSPSSASVFASQQPPPFDHHHALSTTVAAASASMAGAATGAPSAISATHHVADDMHHHYQPTHTITDHSLGGHGGYDGHHAGFDSHFGHGPSGLEVHNLGGVSHVADAHAAGAHQAMPPIGLGISRNHSAADAAPHLAGGHTFDSHNGHGAHAVDNHHGGGGGFGHVADNHVGHDLNHVGGGGGGGCFGHAGADLHHVQPPLSAHHVADAFVAPSPQPTAHHVLAAEYSHGGGHHVPDFIAAAAGGGGGAVPLHHVSPPQSFRSGGFNVAPAAFSAVTAASGSGRGASPPAALPASSTLEIPPVKQPSVAVLILLLIIIPVLSLSPYWGYHGPSTVSAFMMDEFGLSYLDLGLMFSLYSLPNLFMPFIAGNLIDKWGLSFSSLLFNIFCLLGNILLAITFYMPEKPISLLLISRVVFGFGGEAIIMCQQVMLTRWFSGTLLVVASGFVQIFVLCLGSGGAFLFLPHFGRDKVYISLMHVLFVSFWGFVFNLFYVALEWKWMPFLITKFLNERQQAAKGDLLPLSRPTTLGNSSDYATVSRTTTTIPPNAQNSFAAVPNVQDSHFADPSLPGGGHLALAPADGGAGVGGAFGGFADSHHAIADNHHAPVLDTHHALFGGSGGSGGCMGGGGHHVDNGHLADYGHHFDAHALNGGGHFDAHHAADAYTHAAAPFDERHALNNTHFAHTDVGSHFVAQPTPRFPSPAPQQTTPVTNTTAAIGNVEDWGYFRIEGRAQIVTRDGREEWENITIEGGGRIGRQGGRRVVDTAAPPASLLGGLRNRFRPSSGGTDVVASPPAPVAAPPKPSPAPVAETAATPFLFYPRVFTSKTVGEDLQNLPFVYWLVVCMLFCVAPVLPAFTAFAPLFLQDKFGLGAIASSRAASLVYCVGAGAPFAAFLLAKLRVRSFIQLLTLGGVASFFLAFYFCGDDSFLPWFFLTGLGLLYCVVLGNGYAWVELTVPKELLGTATALSLAVTNAGMALAPFVVGLLREISSDFDTALLGLLGFVAAGFFFASLVLVVDVAGQGVLIGAQLETVEAERAELRRLRALKQALLDAEDAQVRQREREAAEERELELEVRAEVEREVRRRRAERAQQRLQQQQPLPLATAASVGYSPSQPTAASSVSPASAAAVSSSSSSSLSDTSFTSSSSSRSAERVPLLSPQQRTRSTAVGSTNATTNASSGKRV